MVPFLVLVLAGLPSHVASTNLRAGTPLPPADSKAALEAALDKVAQDVKSLKVPAKPEDNKTSGQPLKVTQMAHCSFLGGYASGELSQQCCTNIQVVTQRQLQIYGLASKCKSEWKCEADGATPVATFEAQSLSALCGEPGCLPRVVKAMRNNPLTAEAAEDAGHICSDLASLGGGNASAEQVRHLLSSRSYNRAGKGAHGRDREEGKKKGDKGKKGGGACFPGEAMVHVQGAGQTPLAKVGPGDLVLVDNNNGQMGYEPVLAFLHSLPASSHPFMTIAHEHGIFRATSNHIVFVASDAHGTSWTSKLVGNVRLGDYLISLHNGTMASKPGRVLDIRSSRTVSGMFAPLTYSGTIVVDGVVASNYASSSRFKHLPHTLVHAFLFPVRLYHRLALSLWPDHVSRGTAEEASAKLHPYLEIMKHLHVLVPSQ